MPRQTDVPREKKKFKVRKSDNSLDRPGYPRGKVVEVNRDYMIMKFPAYYQTFGNGPRHNIASEIDVWRIHMTHQDADFVYYHGHSIIWTPLASVVAKVGRDKEFDKLSLLGG